MKFLLIFPDNLNYSKDLFSFSFCAGRLDFAFFISRGRLFGFGGRGEEQHSAAGNHLKKLPNLFYRTIEKI